MNPIDHTYVRSYNNTHNNVHSSIIMPPSNPSHHLYYNGKPQQGCGPSFQTVDPSTARPLATVHSASNGDIDTAVQSAQRAFKSWSSTPAIVRSRILQKAVHLLRSRNDEIAKTETLDTGKPFSETSTVDVTTGADVLEFYANLVASGGMNGETVQLREDCWVYTKKEALGVCAGIGAWNYPIQMYVRHSLSIIVPYICARLSQSINQSNHKD